MALIRATRASNIDYFADTGLASPRLCVAHCVWVDEAEQALMAADRQGPALPWIKPQARIGLAPVAEMRRRGISVSLGADGAACNNRLDMFDEMRLAATLQAVRCGPGALPARDVVCMATREGARALGLEHDIGSIAGQARRHHRRRRRRRPHLALGPDPYSTLVYAARGTDVRTTIVDGDVLVDDGVHRRDPVELAAPQGRGPGAGEPGGVLIPRVTISTPVPDC